MIILCDEHLLQAKALLCAHKSVHWKEQQRCLSDVLQFFYCAVMPSLILPPFLNISPFRDFNTDYIRMYRDILYSMD